MAAVGLEAAAMGDDESLVGEATFLALVVTFLLLATFLLFSTTKAALAGTNVLSVAVLTASALILADALAAMPTAAMRRRLSAASSCNLAATSSTSLDTLALKVSKSVLSSRMRLSICRAVEPTTSTMVLERRDSGSSKRVSVQDEEVEMPSEEVELPPAAEVEEEGPKIWEYSRSRSGTSTLLAADLRRFSRRLSAVSSRSRADNLGAAASAAGVGTEWTAALYAETRDEESQAIAAVVARSNELRRRVRVRRRWSGPVVLAIFLVVVLVVSEEEAQLPEEGEGDAAPPRRWGAAGPILSSLLLEEASVSRAMI